MKASSAPNLSLALAHHPVVNKKGEVIASAVTNLDLHDMARAARTYGVHRFYVTTPLDDQKRLVERIVAHWTDGVGGAYNPARRRALELIRIRDDVGQAADDMARHTGQRPRIVATSAQPGPKRIGYRELRQTLASGRPHLLVFGTAWGLSPDFLDAADGVLEPIQGRLDYNHLSVRSAAAIILDRLVG